MAASVQSEAVFLLPREIPIRGLRPGRGLGVDEVDSPRRQQTPASARRCWAAALGLACLGAVVGGVATISAGRRKPSASSNSSVLSAATLLSGAPTGDAKEAAATVVPGAFPEDENPSLDALSEVNNAAPLSPFVAASNEYGASTQFGADYPWLEGKLLVEPHKVTTLTLVLPAAVVVQDGHNSTDDGDEDDGDDRDDDDDDSGDNILYDNFLELEWETSDSNAAVEAEQKERGLDLGRRSLRIVGGSPSEKQAAAAAASLSPKKTEGEDATTTKSTTTEGRWTKIFSSEWAPSAAHRSRKESPLRQQIQQEQHPQQEAAAASSSPEKIEGEDASTTKTTTTTTEGRWTKIFSSEWAPSQSQHQQARQQRQQQKQELTGAEKEQQAQASASSSASSSSHEHAALSQPKTPVEEVGLEAAEAPPPAAAYEWTVYGPDGRVSATFASDSLQTTYVFTDIGPHRVVVTAPVVVASVGAGMDEEGAEVQAHGQEQQREQVSMVVIADAEAHCLYVKREVRSLTTQDREAFLDAMHALWAVPTSQGRQRWGPQYTGADVFIAVHADQATGEIGCDHWHEGTGFLTHHLALSSSFDLSLQSVNPAVTLPYWDFTIDGERLFRKGLGPKALFFPADHQHADVSSPLFTAQWFGSTDALSHVADGRWAHEPATRAVQVNGQVANSYGIIRAPWNNARDPEMVRHVGDVCGLEPVNKPVPSCATHQRVMNLTSLPQFLLQIAGYGHGPMHVNIGGVFGGCADGLAKLYQDHAQDMQTEFTMASISSSVRDEFGVDPGWTSEVPFNLKTMVQKFIHLEYFHIYRMLWRSQTCALDGKPNALSCPEECDANNVPESECVCTCAGMDLDDEDQWGEEANLVLGAEGGSWGGVGDNHENATAGGVGDNHENATAGGVGDNHENATGALAKGSSSFDWENLEPCMYSSDTSRAIFKSVVPKALRRDVVRMFCSTGVKEGEMLESASPSDPLFWMIHPILDRMLTAKRLAFSDGGADGSDESVSEFRVSEEFAAAGAGTGTDIEGQELQQQPQQPQSPSLPPPRVPPTHRKQLEFGSFGRIPGFTQDKSWLDYSFYGVKAPTTGTAAPPAATETTTPEAAAAAAPPPGFALNGPAALGGIATTFPVDNNKEAQEEENRYLLVKDEEEVEEEEEGVGVGLGGSVCSGHGPEDAVLEGLALPASLIEAGDANGDGALNNVEFYAALDPATPQGKTYVFDHFRWDHCNEYQPQQPEQEQPLPPSSSLNQQDDPAAAASADASGNGTTSNTTAMMNNTNQDNAATSTTRLAPLTAEAAAAPAAAAVFTTGYYDGTAESGLDLSASNEAEIYGFGSGAGLEEWDGLKNADLLEMGSERAVEKTTAVRTTTKGAGATAKRQQQRRPAFFSPALGGAAGGVGGSSAPALGGNGGGGADGQQAPLAHPGDGLHWSDARAPSRIGKLSALTAHEMGHSTTATRLPSSNHAAAVAVVHAATRQQQGTNQGQQQEGGKKEALEDEEHWGEA